jgi:5-keto 4-deoxyuronate isomerase
LLLTRLWKNPSHCHPERSEGPLYLNFQANTEVLRRLRLLRMTV